jgi:hypothetical protein
MIDWIRTYIKFVLLHRWNRVSQEGFGMLDEHWEYKPTKGINLWLYNKIKEINRGGEQV